MTIDHDRILEKIAFIRMQLADIRKLSNEKSRPKRFMNI